ncbi:uncharacterized protein LOC121712116 [Alosa sapidissima]|uniref:uncharacterized protein LOC121712116 n=1 Tax=Alosa sapidissima TaxID=34773 RepID=UPI001C09D2F9|nr:uncharacterized protein LOC121712116 [Alosa sapidissima]XP_041952043.1 uncharacterized protein LOC121712116 [Alosa sapidissima]XP_041952044.1 uncharacterized protein LOC121712116 [Alosa sapidissima]XP_041952045.1 uncharacterized protein LOC121712116 [Alosa sapidissima]XP_041952046.1 uncharacterized protein LOC121712116 [Alosa sapidissima]XP_041952048.1 uncharacterized protein LOC121712116 [Alosa sapidissima]XP_041952049.1 uncharacterized protein LOC121712116 [Alosa sapidissima]XP_04195205
MYHEWHELVVRLDVWHLMRRFARGVTTDRHQLYGLFMVRISFAIFEWDDEDVARLREAKQSVEGKDAHIKLSAKELARHCRRHAGHLLEADGHHGRPIDRLLHCMEEIWSIQRRYLDCIHDPEGVELYTQTGEVTKGGVMLPVFRCARGSTSLESFHLHKCRFIPGASVSDVHFQVYLLEGLVWWNEDRGRAAVEGGLRAVLRCYSAQLQHRFNQHPTIKWWHNQRSKAMIRDTIAIAVCRAHSHEGKTLAGVRINRWGAVMRDYKQIQDNVVN